MEIDIIMIRIFLILSKSNYYYQYSPKLSRILSMILELDYWIVIGVLIY